MRTLTAIVSGAILAIAMAASALAGPPAVLREDPLSHEGRVTLGDLFYDAGNASGVLAGRGRPGQILLLDATQLQILARSSGVDWGNPQGLRRIVVPPAAMPAPEPAAQPKPKIRANSVLAYLHNMNTGDIVRAEDLTWTREAPEVPDAPRDPDSVIGFAARRPLREGDAASLRDVIAPLVIRKDDLIAVTFSTDGVSLTLQAKAMENATAGQSFAVINTNSKKIIQVVATGPGSAVVGPAAEEVRSTRSRLALR